MSNEQQCDCVECKIRRAIGGSNTVPTDIVPVIFALGNVMAECLAHVPAKTAKALAAELIVARKKWLKEPRVRTQHPEGNA